MCFYIHSKHKTAKIAKKDIICYKILSKFNTRLYLDNFIHEKGIYFSSIKNYIYNFNENKKYISNIKVENANYWNNYNECIHIGIHSYSSIKRCRSYPYSRVVIVKCIIPKGSTYYYNPDKQEYVSDTIEFIELIDPKTL